MKIPSKIQLHKKSGTLEISYGEENFKLAAEYLRVYSPSAEVKGHGPGQEVLQFGKQNVKINTIEPMGNYAIRIEFNDGHDSGIFTWEYLYDLGKNHTHHWENYLNRLNKAGKSRDLEVSAVKIIQP
ncbi:MAG: gamma-butyrobetaine hydroxylase-like domain-containing protein [Cellvibrionaceae bacterium]